MKQHSGGRKNIVMMTAFETRVFCIAAVLATEPETWAKAQADAASNHAKALLKAGKIDVDVYGEIVPIVSGNHSAMRQKLTSYGFFVTKEADSAEKREIAKLLKEIADAKDAELKKM